MEAAITGALGRASASLQRIRRRAVMARGVTPADLGVLSWGFWIRERGGGRSF